MRFLPTPVTGAWLVEPEARADARGSFARLWCRDEFAAQGLRADFVQSNASFNVQKGTLRGLHYQAAPYGEIKLVSCVRGRVFDVIVDMRPASPTYRQWFGTELTPESRRMVYVPEQCAHGYLTLEDGSEVTYPVTMDYHPESERGLRWNDPAIGIDWPLAPTTISPKDQEWKLL
jgi:dTDP-4-dehydrorhamnose 3,5-epimerase